MQILAIVLIGKAREAVLWLAVAVVTLRAVIRLCLTVELRIPHANLNFVSLHVASVQTDSNSVVDAAEIVSSVIESIHKGDYADALVLVASEVTSFKAFAGFGVCRVGINVGAIASVNTANRMSDIVSEDSLRIVITSVSGSHKACVLAACGNIVLEDDIVGRVCTIVGIVSITSLFINCHINEVQVS